MVTAIVYLVVAFLLAAFPTGLVVLDARGAGPPVGLPLRNFDADEVVELERWPLGLVVLGGDLLKAFLLVLGARLLVPGSESYAGLVAVLVFAGHVSGLYTDLRAGKGLVVMLGAMLALAPLAVGVGIVAGALTCFFRRSLLWSSMVALAVLPVATLVFDLEDLWACLVLVVLVVYRYRGELKGLGTAW
jgi:acyl phosphate:glycerol-3-phosphate acyltransferase